jgi:hypothetical protein
MTSAVFRPLVDDLRLIFGDRLDAVVAYGGQRQGPRPALVLVRTLDVDDLNACAGRLRGWRKAGLATPLVLTTADFERSLDAFPIEYGDIIASHEVVDGRDPFTGLAIRSDDLRRACEVQAKSHLLHVREDYVEAEGRLPDIEELVRESAPGFVALLRNLARLDGGAADASAGIVAFAQRMGLDRHVLDSLIAIADGDSLSAVDAVRLFPDYLKNIERLAEVIDRWRTT